MPHLFFKEFLALFGPLGEMEDYLSANSPGQLPYLLGDPSLLVAALAYDPYELLHAYSHYHIFVLNCVLRGRGGLLQLDLQPFL